MDKYDDWKLPSWKGGWRKRYTAGVMLLDIDNPAKVIGMSPDPLLVPEEPYKYEMEGYRGVVVFPCGLIVEKSGQVKIYYGAADTVTALATADLGDLLNLCKPFPA